MKETNPPPTWCQYYFTSGTAANFVAEIPANHHGKARLAKHRLRELAANIGARLEPVSRHAPEFQSLKNEFGSPDYNSDHFQKVQLIHHENLDPEETGHYLIATWNEGGHCRAIAFRVHSAPERNLNIDGNQIIDCGQIRRQMDSDEKARLCARAARQIRTGKIVWKPRQSAPPTPRFRRVVFSRTPGSSNSDDDGDGDGPPPNPSILLKLKGGAQ